MDLEKYEMKTKNKEVEQIPYIAYESALARHERTVKRMIVSMVILVLLLVISNACWLYVLSGYEFVDETTTTTVTQDGKGQNVYGNGNNVNNGAEDSNKTETKKAEEEE